MDHDAVALSDAVSACSISRRVASARDGITGCERRQSSNWSRSDPHIRNRMFRRVFLGVHSRVSCLFFDAEETCRRPTALMLIKKGAQQSTIWGPTNNRSRRAPDKHNPEFILFSARLRKSSSSLCNRSKKKKKKKKTSHAMNCCSASGIAAVNFPQLPGRARRNTHEPFHGVRIATLLGIFRLLVNLAHGINRQLLRFTDFVERSLQTFHLGPVPLDFVHDPQIPAAFRSASGSPLPLDLFVEHPLLCRHCRHLGISMSSVGAFELPFVVFAPRDLSAV